MYTVQRFVSRATQFLILGGLLLILQGCQHPLVKVDVTATSDLCAVGAVGQVATNENGEVLGACPPPIDVTETTQHDGLTCEGGHICSSEDGYCFGRPPNFWRCDTIQTAGGSGTHCGCICTPNPT